MGGSGTPDCGRNLSADEVAEIRWLLYNKEVISPNLPNVLPRAWREINLLKWNGKKEEFRFYMSSLKTRIETEMAPFM